MIMTWFDKLFLDFLKLLIEKIDHSLNTSQSDFQYFFLF